MTQSLIFTIIYSIIISYIYKKKIYGSSLLFIYTGVNLLTSFFIVDNQTIKEFLSYSMLCNIFILFGYLLIKNKNSVFDIKNQIINHNILNKVFLIFSLFIFYHYFMIGIPFLSENIDTLRFNVRASGLFGLPSRLAFYGITALFVITLLSFEYDFIKKKHLVGYFLIIFLFVLFQSGKSSVLPLFFYLIICIPYINNTKKYIYTKKNFLFLIIIVLYYFLFIFYKLQSITNIDVLEYYILRKTVIAYNSGIFLLYNMSHNDFNFVFNNAVLNDLFYPIFTLFEENVTTLNEQLSRALYFNYTSLSVPVTPGWFAYHYFIFRESALLTFTYSFCFGIFNGFLENKAMASSSLIIKTTFITIMYWMWAGYTKGNIYYIVLNLLLTLLILFMINIYFKKNKTE
jgi:hypothetical protein